MKYAAADWIRHEKPNHWVKQQSPASYRLVEPQAAAKQLELTLEELLLLPDLKTYLQTGQYHEEDLVIWQRSHKQR